MGLAGWGRIVPVILPAEGADVYRNFAIPFQVPAGKYVRAVEFRPSNRKVVHHAILGFDTSGKVREREGKDGSAGFTQVNFPAPILPGSLAFWVPGKDSRPLPEGASLRWPTGADLVMQLHIHPSGKPEVEQSTIGIYFTDEAPRRNLELLVIQNKDIDIPAGKKDFRVKASRELPVDVEVFGIFPHMHLIGKEVKVTALLPDGKETSLLRIDDWDFNWQGYYEYAAPVALPKGTRVLMECAHDNSAGNPSNPNQPPKRVVYGEETANEMAIVLLHAFPKGGTLYKVDVVLEAKEVIRRHDKDGDGKLDAEELGKIPGLKDQDVKGMVKRYVEGSKAAETPYDLLTDREREVLKLLAEGMSIKEAAARLGVSAKTVDAHKTNLMRKLDIHGRADLTKWAIQNKLIRLPVLK